MSTTSTLQADTTRSRAFDEVVLPKRRSAGLWMTYSATFVADILAVVLSIAVLCGACALLNAQFSAHEWMAYVPAVAVFFLVFAMVGLYPGIAISPIDEFRLILRAASIVSLLFAGGSFFLHEGLFPLRSIYLLAWVLIVALVTASRRAMRGVLAVQPWWGIPAVVLGEPDSALMMYHMLKGHIRLGLRPVALLLDQPWSSEEVTALKGEAFVGSLSHTATMAEQYGDCYAIIAMPSTDSKRLADFFTSQLKGFHRVLILPDLFGTSSLAVSAKDICGMLTLQVEQRLSRRFSQMAKRAFDLTVCTAVMIPLLPLFAFLCVAVKLSSKGPVFFGHWRIGRNDRRFRAWKFRTMIPNANEELQRRLAEDPELRREWEVDHKLRNDPRITWIGKFLRRSSLDEIPQLWNVLVGEMSLVGPRPITLSEVDKYGTIFHQYKRVIPGITGLWQVSGRNNVTYARRVEIDDYYVRNWSLALDLYILLRTIRTVLLSEGAC